MARTVREKLIELIQLGDFEMSQILNDGDEEAYEGCMGSLFMAIEDNTSIVKLLKKSDPLCRPDAKTFMVAYDTMWGSYKILIWEI